MSEVSTLRKGLDLLAAFDNLNVRLTVREISQRSGIGEGSVYRYLQTLKARGFIMESNRQGMYSLGLRLLELACFVPARTDIASIAVPIMQELAKDTGETVLLAVIHGTKGMCIEKVESSHTLRVTWRTGSTFSLHAGATGKVLLAYLDEDKIDDVISRAGLPRFTDKTITDRDILKKDLESIRRQGFAITRGEETLGICAVAAPITCGEVTANLTVAGPTSRFSKKAVARIVERTTNSAKRISQKMRRALQGQASA